MLKCLLTARQHFFKKCPGFHETCQINYKNQVETTRQHFLKKCHGFPEIHQVNYKNQVETSSQF